MPALLMAIHELGSRRQAIALGFLLSSMIAWGGFHWIIYVTQYFGNMPLPVAVMVQLLFCLVASPQMVAFLWIGYEARFRVERLPLFVRPLLWAALYAGLEYVSRLPRIFPEHLGNTLLPFLSISQAASLGGVTILTFTPLWLGACLGYVRKEGKRAIPALATSIAFIIALHTWGTREIQELKNAPSKTLRVGLIQQNMLEVEKMVPRYSARDAIALHVNQLTAMTRDLVSKNPDLDLIVWPETAYPMIFPTKPNGENSNFFADGYANLVKSTVAEAGVPLLFGGYESERGYDYNSGIFLGADGEFRASYRKQVLLLFGEYIPLSDTFPTIRNLNPQMGNFRRGPGPVPVEIETKSAKILTGVNICYEEILPEYMRGFAKEGARLFLNITKDSWFGDTFEPWQHFLLSVHRSIEHRIPMIRSTNTGLSGVIHATGEYQIISNPFETKAEVVEVAIPDTQKVTLYTLLGEWFAWTCLAFAALALVWAYRKQP